MPLRPGHLPGDGRTEASRRVPLRAMQDAPTSTRLAMHIFVAEKGDYYEIADGLPQNPR